MNPGDQNPFVPAAPAAQPMPGPAQPPLMQPPAGMSNAVSNPAMAPNSTGQTPIPAPSGANQKAVVVEKLKTSSNILVTVSANPSIDQLSACIAMTLLLEKLKKNATAVFSGRIPAALNFLKPADTIEKNTDSLRDFIISLDKAKADKLRYKVEDDVVKIFITPYKTSITEKDLQYNAGDFNVDLIIALGVHHQQDLDTAITAHGRIFHDAVVVSINNEAGGDFGIANWEDFDASSLSELITNLANELGPTLLDTDIATALLTGIVAETNRFSNAKTHPGTMNVSSILLQAGANQQLVNTQLQDLIGTVVNLEAGSEIKPTISADEFNASLHDDAPVEEELVVGSDGSLAPKADDDMPKSLHDDDDAIGELDIDQLTAPGGAMAAAPGKDDDNVQPPAGPGTDVSEALLGAGIPPTPAPVLNESEQTDRPPKAEKSAAKADAEADDTDTTRKAIDDAIEAAPTIQPTAPDDLPTGPVFPALNQPAQSTNEPAPLSNSPADQAFTMPMPPAGALNQPQLSQPTSPAFGTPESNDVPPPLPPPMMPPSFGGSGR